MMGFAPTGVHPGRAGLGVGRALQRARRHRLVPGGTRPRRGMGVEKTMEVRVSP